MTEQQALDLHEKLFSMRDEGYKSFQEKLMPSVDPDAVIGICTPALRRFAAEFAQTRDSEDFMKSLPHTYYEENNLHAFLIEKIRDFDRTVEELNRFLPYVDNWATCDMMAPKVFKKHLLQLLTDIKRWIASEHTYMIRFAIDMLMKFYLEETFDTEYAEMVAAVQSEEYYIKMVVAWYFATALAKQYDVILPYIEENRLDVWTHNKTIQKAVESFRITDEQKQYLKTLKKKI